MFHLIQGKLEKFLAYPNSYHIPQLAHLSSAVHRSTVQKRSFAVLGTIYETLYQAVNDPKNGFKNPSEILPITPETVNKVFSSTEGDGSGGGGGMSEVSQQSLTQK